MKINPIFKFKHKGKWHDFYSDKSLVEIRDELEERFQKAYKESNLDDMKLVESMLIGMDMLVITLLKELKIDDTPIKKLLEKAVEEEDYEFAAILRDMILWS